MRRTKVTIREPPPRATIASRSDNATECHSPCSTADRPSTRLLKHAIERHCPSSAPPQSRPKHERSSYRVAYIQDHDRVTCPDQTEAGLEALRRELHMRVTHGCGESESRALTRPRECKLRGTLRSGKYKIEQKKPEEKDTHSFSLSHNHAQPKHHARTNHPSTLRDDGPASNAKVLSSKAAKLPFTGPEIGPAVVRSLAPQERPPRRLFRRSVCAVRACATRVLSARRSRGRGSRFQGFPTAPAPGARLARVRDGLRGLHCSSGRRLTDC